MAEGTQFLQNKFKAQLAEKKKLVVDAIIDHPPPIPACDYHFNFLLEECRLLTRMLRKIDAIPEHDGTALLQFV